MLIVCNLVFTNAFCADEQEGGPSLQDTLKSKRSLLADRIAMDEQKEDTIASTQAGPATSIDTTNHILVKPIKNRTSIFAWRDSVVIAKRSAYYSLVLPGTGQINNRDYWKLPLVYGAIGAGAYFIVYNTNNYNDARREYAYRLDNPGGVLNQEKYGGFNTTQVGQDRDYYKRFLDISVIATVAIYGLQVMEANVSAHLKGFDVTDDISMQIKPSAMPTPYGVAPSVAFAFNLK